MDFRSFSFSSLYSVDRFSMTLLFQDFNRFSIIFGCSILSFIPYLSSSFYLKLLIKISTILLRIANRILPIPPSIKQQILSIFDWFFSFFVNPPIFHTQNCQILMIIRNQKSKIQIVQQELAHSSRCVDMYYMFDPLILLIHKHRRKFSWINFIIINACKVEESRRR